MSDHWGTKKSGEFDKTLKCFNLPDDSLIEIKSLLTRRCQSKFSAGLSNEGRKAMEEAINDMLENNLQHDNGRTNAKRVTIVTDEKCKLPVGRQNRTLKAPQQPSKRITDTPDAYKVKGDVSGNNKSLKEAGGKFDSTRTTVDVVKHGELNMPDSDGNGASAIEKCRLWMEINENMLT